MDLERVAESLGLRALATGDADAQRRPVELAPGLGPGSAAPTHGVDAAALERDLREKIRGEVRFDAGSRGLYSTDASNYRQIPIGVVIPLDVEDAVAAVAVCRAHGAPIVGRGGGTSLAGQSCNVAVVIDYSKRVHRILDIDADARRARVEPGLVLDTLRDAAEEHGLTFGPDPATHDRCTLGGMIGNNSCGAHAQMAGCVVENVVTLDVLTFDGLRLTVGPTPEPELERIIAEGGRRGEIYGRLRDLRDRYADLVRERYPRIPRRVSGYNLDALLPENGFNVAQALVGTEGTCVTVLGATLRLVPSPPSRRVVVLGYPSIEAAAADVPFVARHEPIALEAFDELLVRWMRRKHLHPEDVEMLPEGDAWLMVEFGANEDESCVEQAKGLMEALRERGNPPAMVLYDDPEHVAKTWELRESGLGATARVPGQPDTWPGWEDSAVAPERLADYVRDLRALLERHDLVAPMYGHFGQGCVHMRLPFDLTSADGIRQFRAFLDEAADLCVRHGGSLSGEHGDGQARGEILEKMFGPELVDAFREFKRIWDPENKMNPGKVVDARPLDADLRLGIDYRPPAVSTSFTFPEDRGDFARATTRCVGVGLCRREGGGTMCPSYMATREEKHSTRGRARLLFEMLEGDVVRDGWRSTEVKEALDLCLACKGCKGECPVNVDMATYKAEFMSHHYAGRLRPPQAYALGLVHWWLRAGSLAPGLANRVAGSPLGRIGRRVAGLTLERPVPKLADETFRAWWRRRPRSRSGGERVLLWPDTFTDHLDPRIGVAATESLENLGFRVAIPPRVLCCGRPLYDFGFLDLAKRLLRSTMDALRVEIRTGTPIVGLEPSCVAVFRDELPNLFPRDRDAARLSKQVVTLAEFLDARVERDGLRLPRLDGERAVLHGHCHEKSLWGLGAQERVLRAMGLDVETPTTGCCGLAGSFGFEAEKHAVSVDVGEHAFLPAVRQAGDDAMVLSDGFSCRTQAEQLAGVRPLHLAEVLRSGAS